METDHHSQLSFRYRPKGRNTWEDQNVDGETKTILDFIRTGLEILTLQYCCCWW